MSYTETIEYETDNNIFKIKASYKVTVDNNYGADADGNRGRKVTYIEDVEISSVVKEGTDNNIIDLIPVPMLRKLETWFKRWCDPSGMQEAEMDEQADRKYEERKEEGL